jgi:membrane-bound acyltransferase YfiQ involved in biofilm formation
MRRWLWFAAGVVMGWASYMALALYMTRRITR